jgi:hypothetical protein
MKSKIWVAAVLGLLVTSLSASVAAAQCSVPADSAMMIKFDADAWSYETNYSPATFASTSGSQLTVVGIVSLFCAPFTSLDALDPLKEYTFIWDGLVSQGTVTLGTTGAKKYTTQYVGGGFRIYEGSSRTAPTATSLPILPSPGVVPDAYTDGTLILSGVMEPLTVIVNRTSYGTYTGSFRANYHATGGSFYDRVGDAINLMDGAWCPVPATNPIPASPPNMTCQLSDGWSAHLNGKWDMPRTVPTLPSTWGKIKSMYR